MPHVENFDVEAAYNQRIDGPMSDERLKWKVALRVYQSDPWVCDVIRRRLSDVSL